MTSVAVGTQTKNEDAFAQQELAILKFWQENRVFETIQKQHADYPNYWYYDGPPFATGLPHHGHLLASTVKDIVPRYYEMKGYFVPRHFGWDCHGIPVEYAVDKDLGLSTQEAVNKLGLSGYNDVCRGIVDRYSNQWQHTIKRIGRWVDFEQCYKTMDTPFMESVWWAFSELWKKDLIYHGVKVMPYSTKLQTSLSNFEASSNYKSVQNPAITVLIYCPGHDAYLAIWTTTPWTLPANLAVCVGPYAYVKVYQPEYDRHIIIAKACLPLLHQHEQLDIVNELTAEDLVGHSYEPLFPYYQDHEKGKAFKVLLDDYVTTTDGTGIVHMAPGHGEDDFRVCSNQGITPVCPLDMAGCFDGIAPDLQGVYLKDADKKIIQLLKTQDKIYHQDVIVHNYPFCPRSDTPLIYRTMPSWFVNIAKIKERLLKNSEDISWLPAHIKSGRFGKWLANAKDWAISRSRYWGTPIPIWINDTTKNTHCVDCVATLEKLTGKPIADLHRDHVDALTFTIDGEPGVYRRISEVLDCWFESGSMPFAQMHYPFENKEAFEKMFPADFISEGIDQTRGWFYTLTVMATCLFDQPAFKHATVNGLILAADGKKMSKSLKNFTPPDELLETHGADALRLYLIQSNLVRAEEQRFCDNGVKEMSRRVLIPWFNAYKFFSTYATIDNWQPSDHTKGTFDHILDQWILSRLQSLLDHINQHMQNYNLHGIVSGCCDFLDDLTNTYIRLNRKRFWEEGLSEDKKSAYRCLYTVLVELSKTMAPFTPFMSENLYQKIKASFQDPNCNLLSVHMHQYPEAKQHLIKKPLEEAVQTMQAILILGRQQRNDQKIKIKTPLNQLTIIHSDTAILSALEPLFPIIQRELNVKNIANDKDELRYIRFYAKLNAPKLGKQLGKDFPKLQQALAALPSNALKDYESSGQMTLLEHTLSEDDILIYREPLPTSKAVSNRYVTIALDTELNTMLLAEGMAREMVNRIQKLRKSLDFEVQNRIKISIECSDAFRGILTPHLDMIQHETLCLDWTFETVGLDDTTEIHIDEHKAILKLTIIS